MVNDMVNNIPYQSRFKVESSEIWLSTGMVEYGTGTGTGTVRRQDQGMRE